MKYWDYLIYFSAVTAVIVFFIYRWRKIRRDHYLRLVLRAFAAKKEGGSGEKYFSSFILAKTVDFLINSHNRKAKAALLHLTKGKAKTAAKLLSGNGKQFEAAGLELMEHPHKNCRALKDYSENFPQDYAAAAETAHLLFAEGNTAESEKILLNVPEKLKGYAGAKKNYLQAFFAMRDGDMLTASEKASHAIQGFEKEQAYFEEAAAHLLLGTIYRVTAVCDTAELMFRTALNLFKDMKAQAEEADANGNLGMLMVMEERFEEAGDYFEKALILNRKIKRRQGEAEIMNQQALTALILNQPQEGGRLASEALTIHEELKNANGQGFSLELLGHSYLYCGQYSESVAKAAAAAAFYEKSRNFSAFLETLYLQAVAFFENKDLEASEKILRQIIEKSKKTASCFHIANAYNLLGLIFLQKKDFRRAKGLFRQSLDFEQRDERLCGIARDYVNISLTEARLGEETQSRKTLQTALEYARAGEDEELCRMIEIQIQNSLNQ